jgi:hypothetical protein
MLVASTVPGSGLDQPDVTPEVGKIQGYDAPEDSLNWKEGGPSRP